MISIADHARSHGFRADHSTLWCAESTAACRYCCADFRETSGVGCSFRVTRKRQGFHAVDKPTPPLPGRPLKASAAPDSGLAIKEAAKPDKKRLWFLAIKPPMYNVALIPILVCVGVQSMQRPAGCPAVIS